MALKGKYLTGIIHILIFLKISSGFAIPVSDGADACEAYFTYTTSSLNPLEIQFSDASSTTSVVTYFWEFGDNLTSNDPNPIHLYSESGIYEVCLYISDATKSCYDVYCRTIVVPIPVNCDASFITIPDGSNPFLYHFQGFVGTDIDSLWWDFGDGATSTLLSPSHLYPDTGTYIVTLHAKNILAYEVCWSVFSDTIQCKINPCISKFEIIPHPINPFIFNFNSLGDGSINSYFWDFGDGRYSDLPNPIHTYEDTGTFVIKLFVSNIFAPDYCNDSSEQSVHIELIPCQSMFTYTQDTVNPLLFNFTNLSSGPGDEWIWTFGDGSTSAEINPFHNYADTGSFNVCLRIRNSQYPNYCDDMECTPINISDLDCSAQFTIERDTNNILAVKFLPIDQGPASLYEWSFGDDAVSQLMSPIHQYEDTGWYTVKHHVQNGSFPQFCNDTHTDSIYLGFLQYPEASFTYSFDSLSLTSNLFHFNDQSKGTHLTNWVWNFGDGFSSTMQNPLHQYLSTGMFQVCLEVSDSIPPKYQLKNQFCKTIQTYRYFDLGGSIYDGAIPINNPDPEGDTAEVALYRIYSNETIIPITSSHYSNLGYYYFQDILEGNYLVRAALTEQSRQAGKYFPTWSKQAIAWTQANPVELNQNLFSENIYLQPVPTLPTGYCGIDGIVLEVNDPTSSTGISTPGVVIYLTDIHGNKLRYNVSDVTGRFLFRNLPSGEYRLVADHPGYHSTVEDVILSQATPFGGNERVKIYKESSIGWQETEDLSGSIVVTNPFGDYLMISQQLTIGESVQIMLYNALGQPVVSQTSGEQFVKIDTRGLQNGIYLLQIYDQNRNKTTRKLIKR